MSSQYALIAEPWPELLEEGLRVEWIFNNDSQLQPPWGEPSPSQLIHAVDFRQPV